MPAQRQQDSSGGRRPPSGEKLLQSSNPKCQTCQRRMTVKQVTPVLFASGIDDVIFGCEDCGTEVKRTVKRT
jgi:hypothetical protein